jgi:hypothetical protein
MNADPAQIVPVSGCIGGRALGVDGFLAAFGRLSSV